MDFQKIYDETIEELNAKFNSEESGPKLAKTISIAAAQVTISILKKYHQELLKEPHQQF